MLIFTRDYDFSEGEQEWKHGFADYPAGPDDSALFELKYAYTDPPTESKLTKRSVMLSGNNLNQDLFMYLKRRITRLKPDTDYTITFKVELGSNLNFDPDNSTGSVYLKAGATPSEPKSVMASGNYVMNIDKGDQHTSGGNMISLGDVRTPASSAGYTLITRNNTMANSRYVIRTNSNGELWLIVGTDSSLEGTTSIFYSRITVVFSAS